MAHKKKIDTGEFSLQGLGFNMLAGGAIFGCTDPLAFNYDATANSDDGSCCLISGCTDPAACNYNPVNPACHDDGSCESTSCAGCTDPTATNHDQFATIDDGSCLYTPIIPGCMDLTASNYDPTATVDDGTCIPCIYGCMDVTFVEYDAAATCDDGSCLTACTYGCMDDDYVEYDAAATCDNGTCVTLCIDGCTDSTFVEYWFNTNGNPINPPATCDDGSCATNCVFGCMDNSFVEYDPLATCPDNTCITSCVVGCMDPLYIGYNTLATCNDQSMCGAPAVYGCTDATACNHDGTANVNQVSSTDLSDPCTYGHFGCCQTCGPPLNTGIDGCCDPSMFNYDSLATCDSTNGLDCIAIVYGCTDPTALNYYAGTNTDDGSCVYVAGCTDATACNYDPLADFDDGSCEWTSCVFGCTDITSSNYNPTADTDDGSCVAPTNLQVWEICSVPPLCQGQFGSPPSAQQAFGAYYENPTTGAITQWVNAEASMKHYNTIQSLVGGGLSPTNQAVVFQPTTLSNTTFVPFGSNYQTKHVYGYTFTTENICMKKSGTIFSMGKRIMLKIDSPNLQNGQYVDDLSTTTLYPAPGGCAACETNITYPPWC